jgi:hypothetical protein
MAIGFAGPRQGRRMTFVRHRTTSSGIGVPNLTLEEIAVGFLRFTRRPV